MSINFDRAAAYYDSSRGFSPEVAQAVGRAVSEAAGATAQTRFLEIGVGTGRIALPVIALGHEYTGVDISQGMMARLREKLDELERETGKKPRAELVEADMQALPFPDASFDVVVAAHIFHLVADARQALREAWRVLRPQGALLICGDAISGREAVSVNETWRAIVREAYGPIPNSSEATDRLLREMLATNPGMQIEEIRPVRWEFQTTVAEELETIRRRLWSNTWVLPDEVFERCFARLRAWCEEEYAGEMDHPLPRSGEFVIRRLRRSRPG